MKSLARAAVVVLASAALSACNIYACTYKTRFIATAGSGSQAGLGSVTVEFMNFRDYSDGEPIPRSLTWRLETQGFASPPTTMTVRDKRDLTAIVAELPMDRLNGTVSASSLDLSTPAERDRVFNVLSSGNGVLFVYGASGTAPLRVDLAVTTREGWHRPNCD